MSMPMTRAAPSLSAAIARMPEPQPKSTRVLPCRSQASSHCRHRAVVGWVPVPKARPEDPAEWPPFETSYTQMFDALDWITAENSYNFV